MLSTEDIFYHAVNAIHMKNLENKVILIFGASSGIGYEIAKIATSKKALVYCAQRNECALSGVKNIYCDVRKKEDIEKVFESLKSEIGILDCLIYNSGHSMAGPLEYLLDEDLFDVFNTNLFGAIYATRYALSYLKKSKGKIIYVSSIGGVVPIVFDAPYSMTKAALNMLAKELNSELLPYKVRASSILVGGTRTPFTDKRRFYNEEEAKEYSKKTFNAYYALAKIEQKGDSAKFVAERIIRVLYKNKANSTISIGLKNKIFHRCSKVLPEKLFEFIDNLVFKQN